MDLSDGLAKDLGRMSRASGVAAVVRAADVPLSLPLRRLAGLDGGWWPSILAAGDDYEVLAAVPHERAEAFKAAAFLVGVDVTAIGEVLAGAGVTILGANGQVLSLP